MTVIQPSHGWRALDVSELWRYRNLFYFLVWRDVKVRYKQTALGVFWALLQPLLAMAIFAVFFGLLARIPSDGSPYPLFVLAALLPWSYFGNAVNAASSSLVANSNLVSKVYFPRLIIPAASVAVGLVDLGVGLVALLPLMLYYGVPPTPALILLPLFVLLAVLTALAVGVWLSALDVQYRDVRYAIPFLVQVWMFATPVAYPASLVPEWLRPLYGLNPMAGVVEGFRWALLGRGEASGAMMTVAVATVLVLLVTGLLNFRRVERGFADVI